MGLIFLRSELCFPFPLKEGKKLSLVDDLCRLLTGDGVVVYNVTFKHRRCPCSFICRKGKVKYEPRRSPYSFISERGNAS